jgi:regulator of cell morphogenesis and NO signaling
MPVSNQSVREIVVKHPFAAAVLQRFDIDLCLQADAPLAAACAQLQLSVEQVLEKLEEAEQKDNGGRAVEPDSLSIERLIQHIVRTHHQFVRRELPGLAAMASKVAAKHGDRAPELLEVAALVEQLRAEMLAHIQKEEHILFPLIAQLAQGLPAVNCFHSLAQPVSMMVREHDAAARIVSQLRQLTHGFEAPAWACVTYSALFAGLGAFERDLDQHIRIENDVLFPQAIRLESEVGQESE